MKFFNFFFALLNKEFKASNLYSHMQIKNIGYLGTTKSRFYSFTIFL